MQPVSVNVTNSMSLLGKPSLPGFSHIPCKFGLLPVDMKGEGLRNLVTCNDVMTQFVDTRQTDAWEQTQGRQTHGSRHKADRHMGADTRQTDTWEQTQGRQTHGSSV